MPDYTLSTPTQAQTRAQIAEQILGPIDWKSPAVGFCKCPGEHLHSCRNGSKDCRVCLTGTVSQAPTVFCLHTACAAIIESRNLELRRAIGKAERGQNPCIATPTQSAEFIARKEQQRKEDALKKRAAESLPNILKAFGIPEADFLRTSPVELGDDPREDWRLLLNIFEPQDCTWIGDTYDSGKPEHKSNFRTVAEWQTEKRAPGNFTCGSIFKNNVFSRSNLNVIRRRFLVIESDTRTREEMLAVIRWLQQFLTLRAVVDTGGKSLHGWFVYPRTGIDELKIILPQLGCDPAMFKPSQPCRLPGAFRAEKNKFQRLLYLHPTK